MRILPTRFKYETFDSIISGARSELYSKHYWKFRDSYSIMSKDEFGWNLPVSIEEAVINSIRNKL